MLVNIKVRDEKADSVVKTELSQAPTAVRAKSRCVGSVSVLTSGRLAVSPTKTASRRLKCWSILKSGAKKPIPWSKLSYLKPLLQYEQKADVSAPFPY